ncbi:MAG: OmpH family outer membrane protein [Cyanobacteria bacterium HKST-UBA06]|nr:OmpH family outer membrane protein [Cyanobacteria bacterium HKST-UBA05]MCA9798074.1 OmpH family outer membrane protein [Cyanobacteria bacterium HKST-UBA04]MCA9806362.1 OmpH family outer membrane protein [Cyanobacteria bacterium HKST-UBA06]MCA9840985.1 OmpH family outer membrane protein [Cyanobacteria bacterium HKST-UBA03]
MHIAKQALKGMVLTLIGVAMLSTIAFAEQIGVVDTDRIGREYNRAKELAGEIRTRERELQTLRLDLAKELKTKGDELSPVEKKSLEDQLNQRFADQFKAYRDWTLTKEKEIREAVETAINNVKTAKSLDIVFTKAVVLDGGVDVTTDVLTELNKK